MYCRSRIIPLSVILVLFIGIFGCGLKPSPGIPADITAEKLLTVLERRAEALRDFSGRAKTLATVHGENESAIVTINYMKPDRFRAHIKGAFGIVLAVITSDPDLFQVYVPSIKGDFVIGRDEDVANIFVPEIEFDFGKLTSLFTGSLPSAADRADSHITISIMQGRALLAIERGEEIRMYTVEGLDMLIVEEKLISNGRDVRKITYSDYVTSGNTAFPRKISISEKDKELKLSFSKIAVNKGLTEKDISFTLPSNAERYFIEKTQIP